MIEKIPQIKKQILPESIAYIEMTLKEDIDKARTLMLAYFLEKIIKRHFEKGNEKYGYNPVSDKYLKWKREHGYGDVLLVLTGKLKKLAQEGKISGKTIVWDFPEYAIHQLNIRPFLDPSKDELDELETVFRKQLYKIRKKRALKAR